MPSGLSRFRIVPSLPSRSSFSGWCVTAADEHDQTPQQKDDCATQARKDCSFVWPQLAPQAMPEGIVSQIVSHVAQAEKAGIPEIRSGRAECSGSTVLQIVLIDFSRCIRIAIDQP